MTAKENLTSLFERFNQLKILVIGDIMVDAYLWGSVSRISPEAPVPIVAINKKENRLGGAANVALNIKAMGATPILCSVIGKDENSKLLLNLCQKQKLSVKGIIQSKTRTTTLKTRIIGNNHQMLRVDEEAINPLNEKETSELFIQLKHILQSEKIDAILFEDYDKGVISRKLIRQTTALAQKLNIPITVDPKKNNFLHYTDVTLIKPNLRELKEGLNIDFSYTKNALKDAIDALKKQLNAEMALVTLSEAGVFISNSQINKIIPAHIRNVADVSGAGDTVISIATLCLAANTSPLLLAQLANLAGGLVCEKVGVVSIQKEELYREAVKLKLH